MLRTRLDSIVSEIYKEEIEINLLVVYLLNAKIRFIDAIEQTVNLYFDYYLNRISYYLENIPASRPTTLFLPLNKILDICNSSKLTFYDKFRKDAIDQKTLYEKQGEFLHKTPLALKIARVEYTTRGVLIDTDAGNVDYKNQWVTKREWDAFTTAIDIARNAMSIVSTEQEVEEEIKALESADVMFNSAKKEGSFVDTAMFTNVLNIAEAERKAIIVSDNSEKVYYKNFWVTLNELRQLNNSITEAQKRITAVRNDEQVVSTTRYLTKAISVFKEAKKNGTYVDKTSLESIIFKAEREIEDVEISRTSKNVDYKKMWVQQDQWETFVSVIENAKDMLSVVSTDEEVEDATDTLAKALKDFSNNKKNGTYIDKSALEAVIRKAEIEIESIYVSTNGLEVDNKTWWVTQKEYDKFGYLLKNSTHICKNVTTDEQVLDETNKLKEQVSDFIKLKKKGRYVNTSLLEKAIKDAEDAQKDIVIDTDADNVDSRKLWVTQKEYDNLSGSIIHAKGRLPLIIEDEEVVKEADSLIVATITFKSCVKNGSFVDKSILSKEILKAENSMMGVFVNDNSANVSYQDDWVTQRTWDILTNSIMSAQDSIKNILTYKQVQNAAKRMRKAVDDFNKSKQKGTFVDTTLLSKVIKNAESKLESISVDEDGNNVMINRLWTTREEWDVFNLAIVEARNAMDIVKTDEQVVEAAELLISATGTFDSVLKFGHMSVSESDDTLVQEMTTTENGQTEVE